MKKCLCVLSLVVLAGCVNPYEKFYQDYSYRWKEKPMPTTEVKIWHVNDAQAAMKDFHEQGYFLIGLSSFMGGRASDSRAIAKGKEVGADIVVTDEKFVGSETVNIPITTYTPGQTSTTTTYGNLNNGSGYGTSFSANSYTTSPGTYNTEIIQRQRTIYRHTAVFMKKKP